MTSFGTRCRYAVRLTAAASIVGAAAAGPAAGQRSSGSQTIEAARVAVVGTDYSFIQLPSTLAAGPTLFAFENRGTKRHEMSIALLKPGVTVERLVRPGEPITVSSRAVTDSIVGLLIARPGERSGGQLYANLLSGRSYVVVCTLKDSPDARPHTELGMIGGFTVP